MTDVLDETPCGNCGHPRWQHWNNRGTCEKVSPHYCTCSRWRRPKDKK